MVVARTMTSTQVVKAQVVNKLVVLARTMISMTMVKAQVVNKAQVVKALVLARTTTAATQVVVDRMMMGILEVMAMAVVAKHARRKAMLANGLAQAPQQPSNATTCATALSLLIAATALTKKLISVKCLRTAAQMMMV